MMLHARMNHEWCPYGCKFNVEPNLAYHEYILVLPFLQQYHLESCLMKMSMIGTLQESWRSIFKWVTLCVAINKSWHKFDSRHNHMMWSWLAELPPQDGTQHSHMQPPNFQPNQPFKTNPQLQHNEWEVHHPDMDVSFLKSKHFYLTRSPHKGTQSFRSHSNIATPPKTQLTLHRHQTSNPSSCPNLHANGQCWLMSLEEEGKKLWPT